MSASSRPLKLREIVWNEEETCIYCVGHVDPERFLEAVKQMVGSDVPEEIRDALAVSSVRHVRYSPLSPYEAMRMGYDSGVKIADPGKGYPVTEVTA